MPKKQGFYSQTLAVPAKKIAGENPVGAQTVVGGLKPTTVPSKPGAIHGLGPETKPIPHPSVKGAHGFGHVAKLRQGHHRMSGTPGAHRIGAAPASFKGQKVFK